MSVYGYLICHSCREYLFLGKRVQGSGFWLGTRNDGTLQAAVLAFGQRHLGHDLTVLTEDRVDERFYESYQEWEPSLNVVPRLVASCVDGGEIASESRLLEFLEDHIGHVIRFSSPAADG